MLQDKWEGGVLADGVMCLAVKSLLRLRWSWNIFARLSGIACLRTPSKSFELLHDLQSAAVSAKIPKED